VAHIRTETLLADVRDAGLPADTIYRAAMEGQALGEGRAIAFSSVQLGNGTAFDIVLTPLTAQVGSVSGADEGTGAVIVSIIGHGAYPMQPFGSLMDSYIGDKLKLLQCDAAAVALFLAVALEREAGIDCSCSRHRGD
jgi:hypothetical protein